MRAALHREESRGSHYREDFLARDDRRWLVNLLMEQSGGEAMLRERPVDLRYLRPEDVHSVPGAAKADRRQTPGLGGNGDESQKGEMS